MNTTTDDGKWIEDRMELLTSYEKDLRAAIALGREQGMAEGSAKAAEMHRMLTAMEADRDRLAKRVQELEAGQPSGNPGEFESRLAATDARLTALVEALQADVGPVELGRRLAALRAPGDDAAAESTATTIVAAAERPDSQVPARGRAGPVHGLRIDAARGEGLGPEVGRHRDRRALLRGRGQAHGARGALFGCELRQRGMTPVAEALVRANVAVEADREEAA